MLVLLAGCGNGDPARTAAPTTADNSIASDRPVGLDIAAIGVHVSDLSSSGPGSDGDIECPRDPQTVAWNSDGTSPGDRGLALMVAPAQGVFQQLSRIGPTDTIVVSRSDGSRLTFKKDPTAATAEPNVPQLELTACGGPTPVNVYATLVQ